MITCVRLFWHYASRIFPHIMVSRLKPVSSHSVLLFPPPGFETLHVTRQILLHESREDGFKDFSFKITKNNIILRYSIKYCRGFTRLKSSKWVSKRGIVAVDIIWLQIRQLWVRSLFKTINYFHLHTPVWRCAQPLKSR